MAPTVENVASCLGALLGQADAVRTPEALGRLWQTIQPERGVRIHTNAQRDRMFLLDFVKIVSTLFPNRLTG